MLCVSRSIAQARSFRTVFRTRSSLPLLVNTHVQWPYRSGLPEYIPYWLKQGLDKQDEWKNVVPIVQRYWLPVVHGETSTKDGIDAMARTFRTQ